MAPVRYIFLILYRTSKALQGPKGPNNIRSWVQTGARFKSGIVSVHIERLVAGGLIERSPAPEDRRRILLKVTPAATPIIEKGRIIQKEFYARTLKGVGEDEIKALRATMSKIERNVDEIIAGKRREEEGNV